MKSCFFLSVYKQQKKRLNLRALKDLHHTKKKRYKNNTILYMFAVYGLCALLLYPFSLYKKTYRASIQPNGTILFYVAI